MNLNNKKSCPNYTFRQGYVKSFDGTNVHWEMRLPKIVVAEYQSKKDPSKRGKITTPIHHPRQCQNPTIIMLDGLGTDHVIWRYVIEGFKSTYPLVNLSYRGHGKSEMPRDLNNLLITDLAKDLEVIINHHNLNEVILMGWSMGSQVAFEYCRKNLSKVIGVVSLCGTYEKPLNNTWGVTMLKALFPFLRDNIQKYKWLSNILWKLFLISPVGHYMALKSNLVSTKVRLWESISFLRHLSSLDLDLVTRLIQNLSEHSTKDVLPKLKDTPILVIYGNKDPCASWFLVEGIYHIPHAELLILPTGSHTSPLEMPKLINLRIQRFLEKHFHTQHKLEKEKINKPLLRLVK